MIDFTIRTYTVYLEAIKSTYSNILRLDEYFKSNPKPDTFCIIRHDVDRKPLHALNMARLENEMGISTTYFFRAKPSTFIPDIISTIADLGHEIGYHYENLSDSNGDMIQAINDFESNLYRFRSIYPVKTISQHGRPLKPFNNLDMWRDPHNYAMMKDKYGLLGEVYLDIDYRDIEYINDTGRNWSSTQSNLRDKVNSDLRIDFKNGKELYNHLAFSPPKKIVFQIHPERWSSSALDWVFQYLKDYITNMIKHILIIKRR